MTSPLRRGSVRHWLAAAALLLLAYAAVAARRPAAGALLALDAGEAAAVCAASQAALGDFYERAKAMGMGAVVVRPQTLRELSESGQVLVFSREELEKWKSVGLIGPTAALKPNVLWGKDPKLMARVAEALRAQGLVASTATAGGQGLIEMNRNPDLADSAGFDAPALEVIQRSAMAPVAAASRVLESSVRLPALLRAVYGQPGGMLVMRLDPAAGAEENLSRLRGLLRPLRERGLAVRDRPAAGLPPAGRWRRWLAWLLAVLGPIIAVNRGVNAFKRVRALVLERSPIASPVAELTLGILAAAAAAAAAGLAVSLLLAGGGETRLPEGLAFSAMVWPLAIGALALYPFSARAWSRRLRGSPSYAGLLRGAVLALAGALLFAPRLVLAGTPLWDWLQGAADASVWIWWWPWRWREFLVGLPALLYALYLVGRQLDGEAPHASPRPLDDPRPWLWLGMLFPIGTIAALGRAGLPPGLALAQTAVVVVAGLALGGAGLSFLAAWRAWDQSPKANRTIDPERHL